MSSYKLQMNDNQLVSVRVHRLLCRLICIHDNEVLFLNDDKDLIMLEGGDELIVLVLGATNVKPIRDLDRTYT